MDNVDIENLEEKIEEVLASHQRSKNGIGSDDRLEDLKQKLALDLGLHAYACNDFNDYTLDRGVLKEFEAAGLGSVSFHYGSPKLIIENPADPEDPIEVPISDPTMQYPN